ncbi:Cuticle protein 16.8 [Sarcoptes scabiei]|uniref:Cuticle protein 16.8 n=1 Tax=Sarcoptes scabiei TaxID=52283 RepID=A0A834RJW9_SARSC|nr:Cuticle protein 16.8 [Sarcoptes scabiei]
MTKPVVIVLAALILMVSSQPIHRAIDFGGALGPLATGYHRQPKQPQVQIVPNQSFQPSQPLVLEKEEESPKPFSYSYDTVDELGNRMGRQESGDGSGTVTGFYSYQDINGMARIVRYIADASGFRAQIQTNEPGTETSNPADAEIISSQPSVHKS